MSHLVMTQAECNSLPYHTNSAWYISLINYQNIQNKTELLRKIPCLEFSLPVYISSHQIPDYTLPFSIQATQQHTAV